MSQILFQTLDFLSVGTPSVGDFILGVDVDGIPKLKRNTDTIPLYATGSTNYYPVSFYDFNNMVNTSSLIGGSIYVIQDFQTRHYTQYTDSVGDGTGMDELVNVGGIEPLVVLALSNDTYDSDVKSLDYPDDEIKWRHDLSDREFDYANNPSGIGKGHIIYRKSLAGNSRDYDFRNVKFRRWNDGTGTYSVVMKIDAPNAYDFIDYKSFEEGYQLFRNNQISSIGSLAISLGIPYYLDNIIISTQSSAFGNYVIGHGVTIDVKDFSDNTINLFLLSEAINQSTTINFNQFDSVILSQFHSDVTFNQSKIINTTTISGTMNGNIILGIYDSTLGSLQSNKITTIDTCNINNIFNNMGDAISLSNITTLTNNDINTIDSCTCSTIDSNICNLLQNNNVNSIYTNVVDYIQDNIISGDIYSNIGDIISGNSGSLVDINGNKFIDISGNGGTGSIRGNTSKTITNNSIDGNIADNIVIDLSYNTNTGNITNNISESITYNSCGVLQYNNVLFIENNTSGDFNNNIGNLLIGNSVSNCTQNNVYAINTNNIDQITSNQGYTIDTNIGPGATIDSNSSYAISGNSISTNISANLVEIISGNTSDSIYENTSGAITNNNCLTINNNQVNSIDSNTASQIGDNNVLLIFNNVSDVLYNSGFVISLNTGGTISNNSTNYMSGNKNINYISNNNSIEILNNNTPIISGNDVNSLQSNTASVITSNKSFSINRNVGSVLGTNSVHTIDSNLYFTDISYNVGEQLTNNTFNASYSRVSYNNFNLIQGNTYSQIVSNNVNSILNNRVSLISSNNMVSISNNYNLYQINNLAGLNLSGLTGSTGFYYLELTQLKNVNLSGVRLNGNIRKHTFLSDIENLSLTPSTDMQFVTYSTVSRYLFDLNGHYEERANSTGLTYSGPIA